MLKQHDIVKLEINNMLFDKRGIGTVVAAYVLRFDGGKYIIYGTKRTYLRNLVTKVGYKFVSDYHNEFDNTELIMPFKEMPHVGVLNSGLKCCLIDTKSNFFADNYPYVLYDLPRFLKLQKKFNTVSTNAVYVLPQNAGAEFIDDLLNYANAHKQAMFAKRLAYFAEGNALRLEKTR